MKAIVNQSFGDVARAHAFRRLLAITEDALVQTRRRVRQIIGSLKVLANIGRIQHGVFCHLLQPIGAISQGIRQSAD